MRDLDEQTILNIQRIFENQVDDDEDEDVEISDTKKKEKEGEDY